MNHNPFSPSRRHTLSTAAAVAAQVLLTPSSEAGPGRLGPKVSRSFLWGTATAAYQVEGNNLNSDAWLLETLPDTPFKERSGDACDHYSKYAEDISLIRKLGFNTYRFSIEWARVEPLEGDFSDAEFRHYRRMLEVCKANGLKTVLTLHHFTSPIWFSARGGFENTEAVQIFARYAAQVAARLGDLIDYVCTFNEANLSFGPNPTLLASAARVTGSAHFSSFLYADFKAKPVIRACHTAARAAMHKIKPTLPIGLTLAMSDMQDIGPTTGAADRIKHAWYGDWLELARADEFVGVQTYTRELWSDKGREPNPHGALITQIGQEYYPAAIEGTVRWAAAVAKVPVIVTENGIGIEDDAIRIKYIDGALAALGRCLHDGIDLRGYIHWSAMDNFEWTFGYGPKFGLISVDRRTQVRTPKPSGLLLGARAKAGRFL